eukprot:COSAG01_NODE_43575_length_428_cov_1.343465_1_plen_62_part_01
MAAVNKIVAQPNTDRDASTMWVYASWTATVLDFKRPELFKAALETLQLTMTKADGTIDKLAP